MAIRAPDGANKKIHLKIAYFVCTNLGYLTLEGPGRQTVDTRSGVGLFLGSLEFNGSNYRVSQKKVYNKIFRRRGWNS